MSKQDDDEGHLPEKRLSLSSEEQILRDVIDVQKQRIILDGRRTGVASNVLNTIDRLKSELDALRPLPPDVVARVEQKLRIESNYHSNAVEGNSLTLGETRSLILHGLTAGGKPMRDHLDIQGHDQAVKAIERAIEAEEQLTEVFIRNLHRVLLKEPYENKAITPDGRPTTHRVTPGEYKTTPNNVLTLTGEIYHFTPPEQVKPAMSDLIDWHRDREAAGEHPVIIAATFHYRFVRIHPFGDGNGRMARLLMNLILIRHGYTVAIVPSDRRERYLQELERADRTEDLAQFIDYVASCCAYALNLYLSAARGEPIEAPEDIDREIALFKSTVIHGEDAADRVALKRYVEAVANPFYRYFVTKLESISSGISRNTFGPMMTVSGLGVDGSTFQERFYGTESVEMKAVPEESSQVSIELSFEIQEFQNTEKILCFSVDNTLDSESVIWRFRIHGSDPHTLEDYRGQDLDEVKRRFNDLLRCAMRVMERWSTGGN